MKSLGCVSVPPPQEGENHLVLGPGTGCFRLSPQLIYSGQHGWSTVAAYVFSLLPLLHLTYRVSVPCHGTTLISPMAWHRRILISATLTECLYWLIDTDKLSTTSCRKRLQAASNLPDSDLFSYRPPSWFVCSNHHLKAQQQHTQPHAGGSGHSCCWIMLLKYAPFYQI